jgi:hypothetical protein
LCGAEIFAYYAVDDAFERGVRVKVIPELVLAVAVFGSAGYRQTPSRSVLALDLFSESGRTRRGTRRLVYGDRRTGNVFGLRIQGT